jgi:hypothetical protein
MKNKLFIALAALLCIAGYSRAQTVIVTNPIQDNPLNAVIGTTNVPAFWSGLAEAGQAALNWFKANPDAVTATNWFVIPYGVYHQGDFGAGARGYYMATPNLWVGFGLEWWRPKAGGANEFFAPSANAQLQTQKTLGPITYIPFVCAGIVTPVGGAAGSDKTVQGLAGTGLAVKIYKSIYAAGDVETWSIGGVSYRAGVGGSF